MKLVKAADGPIQDWVHVMVDQIPYCISRKRPEICYEGKEPSDLDLLMHNEKHRKNLVDRATIAHKESSQEWHGERPEVWKVSFGSKSLKILWDGSMSSGSSKKEAKKYSPKAQDFIGKKIKKLRKEDKGRKPEQDVAIALDMARDKGYKVPENPNKSSILFEGLDISIEAATEFEQALEKEYGVSIDQISAEQLRIMRENLKKKLQKAEPGKTHVIDESQTHTPSGQPLAPGASSDDGVRWFRAAGDNPFGDNDEKEDDDGEKEKDEKEEKPSEKADGPPKKSPAGDKEKSKKEPKEKGEKKDIKVAKDAIKLIEKLIKSEEGEGGAHAGALQEVLDRLKQFIGEEKGEGDKPTGAPGMAPEMPGPGPGMDIGVEPMGSPAPLGPMGSWTQTNRTGFDLYDRVWPSDAMNKGLDSVGLEPGRIIAFSGEKVVVDWGNDIPTEESPADLSIVEKAEGSERLFPGISNSEIPEGYENDSDQGENQRLEAEKILKSLSLKEMLAKKSESSDPAAVVHIGTGRRGKYVARNTDGRIMASFDGEEGQYWPYEIHFVNAKEGK